LAEAARFPWDTRPARQRRAVGLLPAIQRALERMRTQRLVSNAKPKEVFWGG
jgi:hypothetical protein